VAAWGVAGSGKLPQHRPRRRQSRGRAQDRLVGDDHCSRWLLRPLSVVWTSRVLSIDAALILPVPTIQPPPPRVCGLADRVSGTRYVLNHGRSRPCLPQSKERHNGSLNPHDHVSLLPAHLRRREGHEARLDKVRSLWQDDQDLIGASVGVCPVRAAADSVGRAGLGGSMWCCASVTGAPAFKPGSPAGRFKGKDRPFPPHVFTDASTEVLQD